MNTDLIQMLVNFSRNITQSGINLVMTLAVVMGIVSAIVYLLRFARPKSHRGPAQSRASVKCCCF
ncbi:hypothetical protein [Candidatus Fukatsuia symbiotica]|uniref:hypothetical protein n=1 Tax=Candidatus Fukatsuia symbiotica TaxID=1878942 RepID=UPI0013C34371|nr:hypothetical protein [Candidatus Fukatsuia symbiotica]